MLRNIRLTVEYDGTEFCGWQNQANGRTVQGVLESAVERMVGTHLHVQGSGRTDSGVHARAQIANFRTEATIPILGFVRGLNVLLPRDMAILNADEAPLDFDARRDAHGKRYTYRIWNADTRSALEQRTSWHIRAPLDLDAMNAAAEALLGEHDFSAFRAADNRKNSRCRIRRIHVQRVGSVVEIEVEGSHFLKYMVRIITGTLVAVGRGEIDRSAVHAILNSRDRRQAGVTAPPQGLFLSEVFYGETLPQGRP